ncbi:hypothetical protein H8959_009311 [Pygathrix nigripes]
MKAGTSALKQAFKQDVVSRSHPGERSMHQERKKLSTLHVFALAVLSTKNALFTHWPPDDIASLLPASQKSVDDGTQKWKEQVIYIPYRGLPRRLPKFLASTMERRGAAVLMHIPREQGGDGGKRTQTGGQGETLARAGRGMSYTRDPWNLERFPSPGGRWPPDRATGSRRAPRLAAAGFTRWASPTGEAERKWRPPRLCTNHVRPAGECHPAPGAGSEGTGRALASPPRRAPGPRGDAGAHGAARSPEAPRPHLARSVAEAGQAQRARPAGGACGDPGAHGR